METPVDEDLGFGLLTVVAQLVGLVRRIEVPDNPSLVAMSVLRQLSSDGSGRITDLARAAGTSQPGVTQLVGRLERVGLVRRVPDPADGRGVLVEITGQGREVMDSVHQQYAATLDTRLAGLSAADRAAIARALPALGRLTGR